MLGARIQNEVEASSQQAAGTVSWSCGIHYYPL